MLLGWAGLSEGGCDGVTPQLLKRHDKQGATCHFTIISSLTQRHTQRMIYSRSLSECILNTLQNVARLVSWLSSLEGSPWQGENSKTFNEL